MDYSYELLFYRCLNYFICVVFKIDMNKTALRSLYRQKRKALSSLQIEKLQKQMEQQFSVIDTSEISVAHVFLPIQKHREVNTWPLIKKL